MFFVKDEKIQFPEYHFVYSLYRMSNLKILRYLVSPHNTQLTSVSSETNSPEQTTWKYFMKIAIKLIGYFKLFALTGYFQVTHTLHCLAYCRIDIVLAGLIKNAQKNCLQQET